RECTRLVVGGHPKIIEKLSHNFAATRNFLLIGGSFGRNAYLALVPDRNAIGDRLFLCHGIHSFTACVRIRTALPLTGQFHRSYGRCVLPALGRRKENVVGVRARWVSSRRHRRRATSLSTPGAASRCILVSRTSWPAAVSFAGPCIAQVSMLKLSSPI